MSDIKPIKTPYRRNLSKISAESAAAEPAQEQLYASEETAPLPTVEIRTVVEHRGRSFTIVSTGMTLDQLSDMLDRRGYAAPAQSQEWQRLPDGTPICGKHHTPMRLRSQQGDEWWSHNAGTKENPAWCKGYRGKDSPGYDVE